MYSVCPKSLAPTRAEAHKRPNSAMTDLRIPEDLEPDQLSRLHGGNGAALPEDSNAALLLSRVLLPTGSMCFRRSELPSASTSDATPGVNCEYELCGGRPALQQQHLKQAAPEKGPPPVDGSTGSPLAGGGVHKDGWVPTYVGKRSMPGT